VLTSDGKGVPMRKDEMAKSGRRKKGEKANQKRMACVGSVYTIKPFVRSADDVVDEVMRKEARKNRPKPQHKQVRAELTRPIDGVEVNGKDRIFAWFKQQVETRNPKRIKPVVCVMDGERALWKMLLSYLCGIICILDLFHVLERVWQAAHCFHPEGSDEAQAFVTERLRRILQGDVGRVIGASNRWLPNKISAEQDSSNCNRPLAICITIDASCITISIWPLATRSAAVWPRARAAIW